MTRARRRVALGYVLLVCVLVLASTASLLMGSVELSAGEALGILTGREQDPKLGTILMEIRLPRLLAAVVLGGGLAVSGFLLQTFFANPIAGPYVLGISAGARLAVAAALVLCARGAGKISSWSLILAAFAGALGCSLLILACSQFVRSMAHLLVAGVMIGSMAGAATDFLVAFAGDADIVNLHDWSMGSFSGLRMDNLQIAAPLVLLCVAAAFLLSKPMDAYRLGEGYARSMGVRVRAFRAALILLSSLLSACVAAFAGPISFVGLAVPHLVRQGLRTAKPIRVIPAVFLGGAVFCVLCDLMARTAFSPRELNLSAVTALFGAPVCVTMMLRRREAR